MQTINAFQTFLTLVPLTFPSSAPPNEADVPSLEHLESGKNLVSRIGENSKWSYIDPDEWGITNPKCDGYRQSPVHIQTIHSFYASLPPLRFHYYDVPLMGPLKLVNNGYTVNMEIPPTRNGLRPSISRAKLPGRYEAVGVHFHWGSPNDKGSEHIIDNWRYDVEMHIVHKNERYDSLEEAMEHKNGILVLAVMLRMVQNTDRYYPGLYKIFQKLPQLIEYQSKAYLRGNFRLKQLLGDLNTNFYYTYKGSLTTPPCSEVVIWHIFPRPLPIEASEIYKFFDLMDSHDDFLMQNYRPIQDKYWSIRPLIYQTGKGDQFFRGRNNDEHRKNKLWEL